MGALEDFIEYYVGTATMKTCLKELDVDSEDAVDLFRLLDFDGTGTVSNDQICHGVLRLMGNAKAIDLAALTRDYRQTTDQWVQHTELVEETLDRICMILDRRVPSMPGQRFSMDRGGASTDWACGS